MDAQHTGPTLLFMGGNNIRQPERRELTVKEYAADERVAVNTVYRWIREKAVEVRRTPGGGVRIIVKR
jgi:hypothetical protein